MPSLKAKRNLIMAKKNSGAKKKSGPKKKRVVSAKTKGLISAGVKRYHKKCKDHIMASKNLTKAGKKKYFS